jgi:hypothetical protein
VHDRLTDSNEGNKHSYALNEYKHETLYFLTKERLFKFFFLLLYDHCLFNSDIKFIDVGVVYNPSSFNDFLDKAVDLRRQVGFDNLRFLRGQILNGCFGAEDVKGRVRHRIKRRDGVFLLLTGTEGFGLGEKFYKVGVLGGGVEL